MKHLTNCCLFVAVLWLPSCPVWAQRNTETVSIVVPYPAGGSADVFARVIAPTLGKQLGLWVIVENISGATGALAAMKVLGGPPDGSLLFLGSPSDAVLAPLAVSAAKYRAEDFRLLALLSTAPLALYTRGDLPANTVDELVAYARRPNAKPLSYGSTGHGSLYHIVVDKLLASADLGATHVPYKGGAPLLQDMMGGTIDLTVLPVDGTIAKLVETGKLKVLAVMADKRADRFPNIPTLAESQAFKGFATQQVWAGIMLARATPEAVVEKLYRALFETLQTAEVRKGMEAAGGLSPVPMTLIEASAFYSADSTRLQALAKAANVQPH